VIDRHPVSLNAADLAVAPVGRAAAAFERDSLASRGLMLAGCGISAFVAGLLPASVASVLPALVSSSLTLMVSCPLTLMVSCPLTLSVPGRLPLGVSLGVAARAAVLCTRCSTGAAVLRAIRTALMLSAVRTSAMVLRGAAGMLGRG
jgi:hypothetical protein